MMMIIMMSQQFRRRHNVVTDSRMPYKPVLKMRCSSSENVKCKIQSNEQSLLFFQPVIVLLYYMCFFFIFVLCTLTDRIVVLVAAYSILHRC